MHDAERPARQGTSYTNAVAAKTASDLGKRATATSCGSSGHLFAHGPRGRCVEADPPTLTARQRPWRSHDGIHFSRAATSTRHADALAEMQFGEFAGTRAAGVVSRTYLLKAQLTGGSRS